MTRQHSTLDPNDTALLKAVHGIRFHHVITRSGRLLATFATEPDSEDDRLVSVSCAVCASGDSPSRDRGRQIALGRLTVGKALLIPVDTLKARISDRTLIAEFVGDGLARRLGYSHISDLIGDLRPRKDFVEVIHDAQA